MVRKTGLKWAATAATLIVAVAQTMAQSATFGGNSQHTSSYAVAAQKMNAIKWQTTHELSTSGAFAHYGPPLISPANTVFSSVHTAANGFRVDAFDGATGTSKFSVNTDYILPSYNWIPTYNMCLAPTATGTRLYFPGAGGTLLYIDNPDTAASPTPSRVAFYGNAAYGSNTSGFNGTVFINTPLTADSNGNVFFGFRTQGTAPAPISSTQSGIARIDANGNGSYVLIGAATGDGNISRVPHNAAPALSNDESTLYVEGKWSTNSYYGYLVALDSTTLATKSKVFLKDPRNGGVNNAGLLDDSTASPVVAPDGDVFLGIFGNPYNGSRGFLAHFSGDLSTQYIPGGFGWDQTPGIVPASMVPSYHGPSSYLIFSKYNNYAINDGNGVNKVAILDPKTAQIDPHSSANGLVEMREVLTMNGPTPDAEYPSVPNAVREWCINAPMVNPATGQVFFDSEDGHIYAWDLATNSLSQSMELTSGIGEPYIPTTVGPDGTVYTLNGSFTFAIGVRSDVSMRLLSSKPSSQTVLTGESVTFTAEVTGNSGSPVGTVTFTDSYYDGLTRITRTLGSSTLSTTGNPTETASLTTNLLTANATNLGSHWITATYNGATYPSVSTTRIQKVHLTRTTTTLTPSAAPATFGALNLTATVAPVTGSAPTPTGMVTFYEGGTVLHQAALSGGAVTYNGNNLPVGSHTLMVNYYGDTTSTASMKSITQLVQSGTSTALSVSNSTVGYKQPITLTATITASAPGAGAPKGSVKFKRNGVMIGGAPVNASGVATLVTSALPVGTGDITAEFTGATGWLASTSSATSVTVTQIVKLTLTPMAVASGGTFSLGVQLADTNGATVSLSSSDPSLTLPSSITVAGGSSTGSVNVDAPTVSALTAYTVTATLNGQSLSSTLRILAPTLVSIGLNPSTVVAGDGSTGTVNLSGKAPSGGLTVSLASSNPSVGVPSSVTVPEGSSSETFAITTTAAYKTTVSMISGTLNGLTKSLRLTVNPLVGVQSVVFSPARPYEGQTTTGTVTLNQPAPSGGTVVTLSQTGGPTTSFPATVTVPEGSTGTTFDVTAPILTTASAPTVSVQATVGGSTATGSFRILPNIVASLGLDPSSVPGGSSSTATLTLSAPAPAGGLTFTLAVSSTFSASVDATVTVAEGSTTATFTVNTVTRSNTMNVTVSATRNGLAKSAVLQVTPTITR